jgi:hypothetical protein
MVVDYLQQKANTQLVAQLDNNLYKDSQLIELKVPIHLPYLTNWAAYQRYDGEIEIDGMLYSYVKRKVDNDTLYVMCIPNPKKMHLETAKNDFFKITNDLMQNGNSKKPDNSKTISFKNLQGEYDDYSFALNTIIPYKNPGSLRLAYHSSKLLSAPHIFPEQPPDLPLA